MTEQTEKFYAHSKEGIPESEWHLLENHLKSTGERAASFAGQFSASEWAKIAGTWHDLGKYSGDFQAMLRKTAKVDHSTAGAIYSIRKMGEIGRILAYLIAGHHAGLPDWQSEQSGSTGLGQRLQKNDLLDKVLRARMPSDVINLPVPSQKPKTGSDGAFWIRNFHESR
jgi:CRISPR-associated endonuclease/helicase Cas3